MKKAKKYTRPRATSEDAAIGARLRALRITRKLSQTEIGDKLGVSFQQVQKYENGANRLAGSRLVALCQLLEVKPEQLLGNGSGVFHEGPDTLELFRNKDIVKMFVELNRLPGPQLRAVLAALTVMVRAFTARI